MAQIATMVRLKPNTSMEQNYSMEFPLKDPVDTVEMNNDDDASSPSHSGSGIKEMPRTKSWRH